MKSNNKHIQSIPSSSAIYHAVDKMVFNKGTLAYRITRIIQDNNDLNIPIRNETRLKNTLFNKIRKKYNLRIHNYKLKYSPIQDYQINAFSLVKYTLITKDDNIGLSGEYEVFPRTFYCSSCGDFRTFNSEKSLMYWQRFRQNRCNKANCKGSYVQLSLLHYCEICGEVKPIEFRCGIKEHGPRYIQLSWKEKDALSTWKVVCEKCFHQKTKNRIDIFRLSCKHKNKFGKTIIDLSKFSEEEKNKKKTTKYTTLTIKEGGIFTPVVITQVDMPNLGDLKLEYQEFLYFSYYLKKFNKSDFHFEEEEEINLDSIIEFIDDYHQENKMKRFIKRRESEGKTKQEAIKLWKKSTYMNVIERVIEETKNNFPNLNINNINEFLALIGVFESNKIDFEPISFTKKISKIENTDERSILSSNYENLRDKFGISEITYIPKINLVSSCLGLINGVNKFYEDGFISHFEPIWLDDVKRECFKSYVYPFETEGVVFELDKTRVCEWLIENDALSSEIPSNEEEANLIIMNLEEDSEAYNLVNILLHTYSHLLMQSASLYTGLDTDSCSEMIFINHCAILLYSNASINIGGFLFVFENSLKNWFKEIAFDIEECTFDPTCIYEKGACFSCLYLPEFVCNQFNNNLDRDVFLAKTRYKTGFWRRKRVRI